jgi:hypothetical protein
MWTGQRGNELPPNWNQLREACKEAAHGQCQALLQGPPPQQRCPHPGNEAHHPNRTDHRVLVWLCPFHHQIETQKQARQARRYLNTNRPPEQHPGLTQ